MEDRRKNPARKSSSIPITPIIREYFVVLNGRRWDVLCLNAFIGAFAYDQNKAIEMATAEAKKDTAFGMYAVVSVEDENGKIRSVWP